MEINHRRKRRFVKSEINIVPFLDILLVLLLIFMITTPIINNNIEVKLPDTSEKILNDKGNNKKIVIVEVLNSDIFNLYIDNEKISLLKSNDLSNKLRELGIKNYIYQIAASNKLDYQTLIDSMILIQKAGISDISLVTNFNSK